MVCANFFTTMLQHNKFNLFSSMLAKVIVKLQHCILTDNSGPTWAPPGTGKGGHLTPLDFDINFSHIITVAPRVEIQMHFWKGAKFAGTVGHPMTKMLSASGGLRPVTS